MSPILEKQITYAMESRDYKEFQYILFNIRVRKHMLTYQECLEELEQLEVILNIEMWEAWHNLYKPPPIDTHPAL
jgi:hypothetical protein